jgi:hypothetical protein
MATALHVLLGIGAIFPRVDDLWPDHIGLDLPFTLAGGGGVLGSRFAHDEPQAQRDRRSILFSRAGFLFGTGQFLFALLFGSIAVCVFRYCEWRPTSRFVRWLHR